MTTLTPLQRTVLMNEAFGNKAGSLDAIDIEAVVNQSLSIFDEYIELLSAFGFPSSKLQELRYAHASLVSEAKKRGLFYVVDDIRDALCDIQVFAGGAQHLLGVVPDDDMHATLDGVMSRFIKDEEDKRATIALHASRGVTDVYFEGEYPTMVMKSARDQPDAPKGKFLKAASYLPTVFPAGRQG